MLIFTFFAVATSTAHAAEAEAAQVDSLISFPPPTCFVSLWYLGRTLKLQHALIATAQLDHSSLKNNKLGFISILLLELVVNTVVSLKL